MFFDDINPSTFQLPTLGPRLIEVKEKVYEGPGFAVLRGLNPDEFSKEDNLKIFLGVSSYVAGQRGPQDIAGNLIGMCFD